MLLPQFVCQDGYFVSHIPAKVVLPEQKQVDEFLPPYNLPHPLDPKRPVSHGPQIRPDQGTIMDMQRAQAMLDAPAVIREAIDDFNRIFGRKYSPFVEEFMTDDAEIALFIMGAHAMTARHAIRHLRAKGVKIASFGFASCVRGRPRTSPRFCRSSRRWGWSRRRRRMAAPCGAATCCTKCAPRSTTLPIVL